MTFIFMEQVFEPSPGLAHVCKEQAMPKGAAEGRRGGGTSDLTALMQSDPPCITICIE